jgi:hypothetical protein
VVVNDKWEKMLVAWNLPSGSEKNADKSQASWLSMSVIGTQ